MRQLPILLLLVCVLVACSGIDGTPDTATPRPVSTPPQATPTPLPAGTTTGAQVRARGRLRVGVRYDLQPFGFVDERGHVDGFDVALGREFARRWLGDAEAVEFRQVRTDTAVEHIQAGDIDLAIAALPHTQDGEAGVDFTLPYFRDGQALLVRAVDAASIEGPGSLENRLVGVSRWNGANVALQSAVPFTLSVQLYDRFDYAVAAMGRGEVQVVADLRHRLFWGAAMLPGSVIVGQYSWTPLAMAYPQNDAFFADLVNLTFQEMVADGTYANLYARWFAQEDPPVVERWPGSERPLLTDAPLFAAAPNTLGGIRVRGRLVVALAPDRSPFSYVDDSGTLAGYDVTLVRLLAERWLGDPSAVDFVPASMDAAMEMLRTGQVDMLVGGVAHTRAAEMQIDFSTTTYVAGESLMVIAGTPVTGVGDLVGQQVAVVTGTDSGDVLLAAAQREGVALTVIPQPSLASAMTLLQEGQVAAVAGDRALMLGPAYATPGVGVLPLRLTEVPLAVGLPPGDSAFRDLVNLTLQAMARDGQMTGLYQTWFEDSPPVQDEWPGAPYRLLRIELSSAAEGDLE
ncbi:MAG: transporter substrate-binding domain-containing protein [Chloroflexi bacterium]|nr:transporter substrate-binding domain-containing protein [Chloroflexota bacterium]